MSTFDDIEPNDPELDLLGSALQSPVGKERMAGFAKGNQLWRMSLKARLEGAYKIKSPEDLLEKVCAYFDTLEEHPLQEAQLVSFQGVSNLEDVPKMRAPTLLGLCAFLGVYKDTWGGWRRGEKRVELQPIVRWAEQVMHDIKFTGAAAGLLNPGLIGRDLGLADKTEITGLNGGPIETITGEMSPQKAAEAYAATLRPQQD